MDRIKRKKETNSAKTSSFFVVSITTVILYYFEYDFTSDLFNGILLSLSSFLSLPLFYNNKYYINTGNKNSENPNSEEYLIFSKMHPWITLWNRLLGIAFFITNGYSLYLIVPSIILYFQQS